MTVYCIWGPEGHFNCLGREGGGSIAQVLPLYVVKSDYEIELTEDRAH
jgi:hypothetical protein